MSNEIPLFYAVVVIYQYPNLAEVSQISFRKKGGPGVQAPKY